MFRSISVLVEGSNGRDSVLACAQEWASRLQAPLRRLEWRATADPSERLSAGRQARRGGPVGDRLRPPPAAASAAVRETVGAAAGRAGMAWEISARQDQSARNVRQLFRPFELCIFGREPSSGCKDMLFSQLLHSPHSSALVCPPAWRPVSRLLVLNQHARPGAGFLDAAAGICQAFQVTPVLLTLARSEGESRARERFAEEAFADRKLAVDCDMAVGCDVASAVIRAARWRRCSHVLVEQRPIPRWQAWLGGDLVRELAATPDCPALLAVPATMAAPPVGMGADGAGSVSRNTEKTATLFERPLQ